MISAKKDEPHEPPCTCIPHGEVFLKYFFFKKKQKSQHAHLRSFYKASTGGHYERRRSIHVLPTTSAPQGLSNSLSSLICLLRPPPIKIELSAKLHNALALPPLLRPHTAHINQIQKLSLGPFKLSQVILIINILIPVIIIVPACYRDYY